MNYEVITDLKNSDIFNIAHEFTSLKGSNFSPLEIDFLFAFISQIDEKDEVFHEYQIDSDTLSETMERRMRKERVAKLFDSLMGKYISVSTKDDEKRYSIFDTLSYNRVDEIYKVRFSSQMKPFFLKLKPYTKGYLSDLFKMKSTYSKKIYLLCSQWKRAGSFKIKVEELMKDMQVPKSLSNYADFKRKVLKVAEKNMLEKSKIYFEYEEIKKGRKVNEILFIIKDNPKFKQQNPKLFEADLSDLQKELGKFIGKKIEGKHIIKSFRLFNDMIVADTEIGEYKFPNLDVLEQNIS
jgi:plasmid replication initiation protein